MNAVTQWLIRNILELGREMRLSYLPPLMVYMAAGISGLTGIVGTFFVKDYLGLSAAFLAALGFWAGVPWALKMPLGHLVDLIWRWKSLMVFLGAGIACRQGKLIGVDDYFNGEMLGKVLAEDTLGNAFPQLKNRDGKLLLIIPLRALAKHSEAHDHVQQDLIMRAQMLAQNRENNPDNWQVGDHFVDASGRRITAGGAIKVVGFSTDESGSLHAKMSPSEQHSTSDEGKKWARQNANAVFLMDPKGPLGSLERGRR